MINVHASLLPTYRGAAPVHRAVMAGETRDRRHDHAGGQGARCRADAGRGVAPDRAGRDERGGRARPRASRRDAARRRRSTTSRRASARRCRRIDARATYAHRADEGRRAHRLGAAGRRDSQPDSRPASVAARVHAIWTARAASSCGERRPRADGPRSRESPAPGTIVERVGRSADRVRPATASLSDSSSSSREGRRPMTAREFLAGHPLRRGRAFGRRAMIAPARMRRRATTCRLRRSRSRSRRTCRSAIALATRAQPRATSATARWRRRSPPASSAGRDALDHAHRAFRQASRRRGSIAEIVDDPAPQRLSAAAPHARAGGGRRRRCRRPDAAGAARRAPAVSSTRVLRSIVRGARHVCRCLHGPAGCVAGSARPAPRRCARLPQHHAVASRAGSWRAGSTGTASRPPSAGCGSTTRRRR